MKNIPKLPGIPVIDAPEKRYDTRKKLPYQVNNEMTVEQFKTHVRCNHVRHPESVLQRQCITWFDNAYPALRQLLFAIPNGGKRGIIEAKIMKAEGVRKGVPDLFLAVPRLKYCGLFIEMKAEGGYLRPEQRTFLKAVEMHYRVVVCKSFEQFTKLITDYLD